MIRVAAVGDVHYDRGCRNRLKYFFEALNGRADLLVLTGDLTKSGLTEEAEVLADDLRGTSVPVVAILGNHDYLLRKTGLKSKTNKFYREFSLKTSLTLYLLIIHPL